MALIITPAEIAAATNVSTTDQDVQTAQDIVELFVGRELSDEFTTVEFDAADLRRCRLAVQWQTVYLAEHPEVLTREVVRRASANGASVEFDGDGILAPMAARFIKQVSWSAAGGLSVATLKPVRVRYEPQPDPWVRI